MIDRRVSKNERHQRLQVALTNSNRKLQPFRKMYIKLVEQYAGPAYGARDDTKGRYLNLLAQTVEAYMMILAANNPKVLISSVDTELAGFASHFTVAMNNMIEEIGLSETLQQWVMDSFFCIGVIKVHLGNSNRVFKEGDLFMDPGTPFASNVAVDDFVIDMSAKKPSEAQFVADIYTVPIDDLDDNMYDQKVVDEIVASTSKNFEEESQNIGHSGMSREYLEPVVELIDIWMPRDQKIYTYHVTSRVDLTIGSKPVAEMKWTGSEHGNYHLLRMGNVPNNIMPASPASHLYELDRLINNLMTKQSEQAERQKSNPVYSNSAPKDALNLKEAEDGEWVRVDQPESVKVITQGGASQDNQVYMLQSMEQFDRMAGNLPSMLGLGASSETVGQDKIIQAAGSRRENNMTSKTTVATVRLLRDLGRMLWDDKDKVVPGRIEIPEHPEFSVDSTWTPDDREGDFDKYKFEIDFYSMRFTTPEQKASSLMAIYSQLYAPSLPFMAAQGGNVDFAAFTEILADLLGQPRLKQIIKFRPPDPMQQEQPKMGMQSTGGSANKPNGQYTRTNVSGSQARAVPDPGAWSKNGAK